MMKFLFLSLALFFQILSLDSGQTRVSFDPMAAWSYARDLSSDSMLGRKSGRTSGEMAENYVASNLKKWGIKPAGDNGTYFQNFNIAQCHIQQGVLFSVITKKEKRDFYYGDEWAVERFSGSGHFIADVVFMGYGIYSMEDGYDDYDKIDVKGKIVLLCVDTPPDLDPKLEQKARIQDRIKVAQDHGALGVLCLWLNPRESHRFRLVLDKDIYNPNFVILTLRERVADFIFRDLDTELYPQHSNAVYQEIVTHIPESFTTGIKVCVSVSADFDEKRPARNVLAKIPGSDETLRDEFVLIGAHLDHLGLDPIGNVMNGATDNASGTAVVMEVARVMKLNKIHPKRTVVFLLWAGEEQGLLGSRHYVNNPIYPLEKTVAYINLDVVGQGIHNVLFRGVYHAAGVWVFLDEKLPKNIREYVKPGRGDPGYSDQRSFLEKGIPSFALKSEGYFFKRHHYRDDIDLVKPEMLKNTGDLVYEAAILLSSDQSNLIEPMRREMYYLKHEDLINFKDLPLTQIIPQHKEEENPYIDLQFSVIQEKAGLSGEKLRVDIIKSLLDAELSVNATKSLVLFSDLRTLSWNIQHGKTTILAGLRGINALRDDPGWAKVLRKLGVRFVILEKWKFLFNGRDLSEEGRRILEAIQKSGLLLIVKDLTPFQERALLKESLRPLILLKRKMLDDDVASLIKEKKSALGLILGKNEDASDYFKKLEAAKKKLGKEHLITINEEYLWKDEGKRQLLEVIKEMLRVRNETGENKVNFSETHMFSGPFFRILREASDS